MAMLKPTESSEEFSAPVFNDSEKLDNVSCVDEEKNEEGNGNVSRSSSRGSSTKTDSSGTEKQLPQHQYTKDELMDLAKTQNSKRWPDFLDPVFANQSGTWDPEKWFRSKRRSESPQVDELRPSCKRERPNFESDSNSVSSSGPPGSMSNSTGPGSFKRRTPDPKERIKEERDDIVLSPQRRSFGTGCHVTQQPFPSARRSGSPPDSRDDSLHRDREPSRRIGSGRIVSSQRDWEKEHYGYGNNSGNNNSNSSRGRFGRDSEKDSNHYSGSGRYREKRMNKGRSEDRIDEEDEPEWFSGGPTSQHETIELVGFDDVPSGAGGGPDGKKSRGKRNRESNASSRRSSGASITNEVPSGKAKGETILAAASEQTTKEQTATESRKEDFDLNEMFKNDVFNWMPGFLPNGTHPEPSTNNSTETGSALSGSSHPAGSKGGLGGSRFSQWFSTARESPVKEMFVGDSRRSSLQDELVAHVLNEGGEMSPSHMRGHSPHRQQHMNMGSMDGHLFGPTSPPQERERGFTFRNDLGQSGGEKHILDILKNANINVGPLLSRENAANLKEHARTGQVKSVEELEADLKTLVLGKQDSFDDKSAFNKLISQMNDRSCLDPSLTIGPMDHTKALQENDLIHSLYMGPSSPPPPQRSLQPTNTMVDRLMNSPPQQHQHQRHHMSMPPDVRVSPTQSLMDLFKDGTQDKQGTGESKTLAELMRTWSSMEPQQQQQQHRPGHSSPIPSHPSGHMLSPLVCSSEGGGQVPQSVFAPPPPPLASRHMPESILGRSSGAMNHDMQHHNGGSSIFSTNRSNDNHVNDLLAKQQQDLLVSIMKQQSQAHLRPTPSPEPTVPPGGAGGPPGIGSSNSTSTLGIPLSLQPPQQSPLHDTGTTGGRIPSPLVFGQQPPLLSHAPAPIHPSQVGMTNQSNTLQVQNPPVLPRVPSPQELAVHTQSILQNALIKRKLEEQKENYRKRQEAQRARSPNVGGPPTTPCGVAPLSPTSQPKPSVSPVKQTFSSSMAAFTPTSVMRKMQSEKSDKDTFRHDPQAVAKVQGLVESAGRSVSSGHPRALHGQGVLGIGVSQPQTPVTSISGIQPQSGRLGVPAGRPIVKGQGEQQQQQQQQQQQSHQSQRGPNSKGQVPLMHNRPYMVSGAQQGSLLRHDMDNLARLVEQQRLLTHQQQQQQNAAALAVAVAQQQQQQQQQQRPLVGNSNSSFPIGQQARAVTQHNYLRPTAAAAAAALTGSNQTANNLNLPLLRTMVQGGMVPSNFNNPNIRVQNGLKHQLSQFAALQQQQQQQQHGVGARVGGSSGLDPRAPLRNMHQVTLQQLLLGTQKQGPVVGSIPTGNLGGLSLNNNIGNMAAAGRADAVNLAANVLKSQQQQPHHHQLGGVSSHLLPPHTGQGSRHSPVSLSRWFGNDVLKQKMSDLPPVPHQKALRVEELEQHNSNL